MNVWFVIYCKSRKDDVAERNLLRQGFEIYRPLINRFSSNNKSRVKRIIIESLFPRYLFLNVDPEKQSLTPITYTLGVVGFVKFGDRYSTVTDSVINKIKLLESEQQINSEKTSIYKSGESVFINGEGFSDIKATFCEMRGDDRVVVLLKMLGRMSTILVPTECVSRVAAY